MQSFLALLVPLALCLPCGRSNTSVLQPSHPAAPRSSDECECSTAQHFWMQCVPACAWVSLQFECYNAIPCEEGCHWMLSGSLSCLGMIIPKLVQANSQDPGPEHEPIQCTTEGRIIVTCPASYGSGKFWTGQVSCSSCGPQGG
jgi:hypothetical protein